MGKSMCQLIFWNTCTVIKKRKMLLLRINRTFLHILGSKPNVWLNQAEISDKSGFTSVNLGRRFTFVSDVFRGDGRVGQALALASCPSEDSPGPTDS